jgi:hypothetical protein
MAVKTVGVLGNLAADTERGPSPSIWNANGANNAWIADFIQDPRLGILSWEDFKGCGISPATGSALNFNADLDWYAYLDTNGAITDSAIVGGGIHLAASTTAHQGVALSSLTTAYQLITSGAAVQGRLYFECRLQASSANYANSVSDIFVGLVDNSGTPASAVPITNTGGSLSTAPGLIGFHKRGGTTSATDFAFVYNVAGGTPQYFTQLNTLITTITGTAPAGATFYKLGFVFNPQAEPLNITSTNALTGETSNILSTPYVTIYVNGQPAAAVITKTLVTGTTFPVTVMAPAIAFKQQSTTASVNCDVDWIAVAQEMIA